MLTKPIAQPKPVPVKRIKGRKQRSESAVKQEVRALCVARDGDCRLEHAGLGVCGGASEWSHLEEKKRAKTRGQDPTERHSTQWSAQLCTVHHRRYDAGEIAADFLTAQNADGRMAWLTRDVIYTEPK